MLEVDIEILIEWENTLGFIACESSENAFVAPDLIV
jgi:hypothetical protein